MEHQPAQQSQSENSSGSISHFVSGTPTENQNSFREPASLSPELDSPTHNKTRSARRGLFSGGWRTGCAYFAILAGVVFLFNLTFTIYALVKYRYNYEDGTRTLVKGECNKISRLNTIAHLFINVFSTALLSASSYTMQCLSAPTRREIDDAHRRKQWMDIGVLSLRNLLRIKKIKFVLWCVLAMSSIPLHLIYNSAVVATIAVYDYDVWVMGQDYKLENITDFAPLENQKCIELYGRQLIDDRKDVIVLVPGGAPPELLGNNILGSQDSTWICASSSILSSSPYPCDPSRIQQNPQSWVINGTNALSCLSQEQEGRCMLQYSLPLMIVVLVCNGMKVVSILLAVVLGGDGESDPLITIGDGIDSFLRIRDKSTGTMSLISEKSIRGGIWKYMAGESQCTWNPNAVHWFRAASIGRWTTCYTLSLLALSTVITLLLKGVASLREYSAYLGESRSFAWRLQLGAVDSRLMIPSQFLPLNISNSFLRSVVVANLPQLIFSLSYLLYNSILTCMLLAKEWDEYSSLYRPLRVTTLDTSETSTHSQVPITRRIHTRPRHSTILQQIIPSRPTDRQGSTYFLQLPYRYSIPLMVTSIFLHWIISQSIFVVRIAVVQSSGRYLGASPKGSEVAGLDISTDIGWSPIAIIIAIISSTIILASVLICGFQKYAGHIPFVVSCSAAISAACHADPSKPTITTGKIKWGVVWTNPDGVGHCAFSDEEVPLPLPNQPYASAASRSANATGEASPQSAEV